jgi:hypothetical protein
MVNLDKENYCSDDAFQKMLDNDIIFQMRMKKESSVDSYVITGITQYIQITCPCVRYNCKYSHHFDIPKVGDLCTRSHLYNLASHYSVIYQIMRVEISDALMSWHSLDFREKFQFSKTKLNLCENKHLLCFFKKELIENLNDTLQEMIEDPEYGDKLLGLAAEYLGIEEE